MGNFIAGFLSEGSSDKLYEINRRFKCVVLVKNSEHDAPFLNRFEKHRLTYLDVLSETQQRVLEDVKRWVEANFNLKDLHFTPADSILGFHDNLLPLLVLRNSEHTNDTRVLFEHCKHDLLKLCCSDAVVRFNRVESKDHRKSTFTCSLEEYQEYFFNLPQQNGLVYFMNAFLAEYMSSHGRLQEGKRNTKGFKNIIFTHSTTCIDIHHMLEGKVFYDAKGKSKELHFYSLSLSLIHCERKLKEEMRKFWWNSKADCMIIQCNAENDHRHILKVMLLTDRYHQLYSNQSESTRPLKHVCLIIRFERGSLEQNKQTLKIRYISEWELFTLETLETHVFSKTNVEKMSLVDILNETMTYSVSKEQLFWAFSSIQYRGIHRDIRSLSFLLDNIVKSQDVIRSLGKYVIEMARKESRSETHSEWETDVACDKQSLFVNSSMAEARKDLYKQNLKASTP